VAVADDAVRWVKREQRCDDANVDAGPAEQFQYEVVMLWVGGALVQKDWKARRLLQLDRTRPGERVPGGDEYALALESYRAQTEAFTGRGRPGDSHVNGSVKYVLDDFRARTYPRGISRPG